MTHRPYWLLCTIICFISASPAHAADEAAFDARSLFDSAITTNLRPNDDGSALELTRGEVIEDDGPAAGYSYKPNEERVAGDTWIKKDLLIPDPRAEKATLLIGAGGSLKAVVNGKPVPLQSEGKVGGYWEAYPLPPDVLRPGKNEIVLHGAGKVWIARDDEFAAGSLQRTRHPNRSARSTDAGRTWDYDHLGPDGTIDGEYYVRIFLDRYRPAGTVILPVLDAGNLAARPIADPVETVDPVQVRADIDAGTAGSAVIRTRSGTTLRPDDAWSEWRELGPDRLLKDPAGRFVQVAVELSTTDPLQTPKLKNVSVEATPKSAGDWAHAIQVIDAQNEQIVRSSIPFEYEPFDHPRLKELRERYKLDEVVSGADGEFELMCRLAEWSSAQWGQGHLAEAYPAWDALEILKLHGDGKPVGGFCQQYHVVFLQACESFGIPGRAVSLSPGALVDKPRRSGHEVVELWSNEHRKWVYIDGQFAWYAADAHTGEPLSLLELRNRQLIALGVVTPPSPPPETRIVKLSAPHRRDDWTGMDAYVPLAELRLIPRSNFLQALAPLPLNQGMRGWFWTGHYVWTDDKLPAAPIYDNRVVSRSNWEWTLNQARYALEATATPGELTVHLDTETPGFDRFIAVIDGGEKQPVDSGFTWKLNRGKNRLELRPRNIAGREGIRSSIELDWP